MNQTPHFSGLPPPLPPIFNKIFGNLQVTQFFEGRTPSPLIMGVRGVGVGRGPTMENLYTLDSIKKNSTIHIISGIYWSYKNTQAFLKAVVCIPEIY